MNDLDELLSVTHLINKHLLSLGMDQWNFGYPNKSTYQKDIEEGTQYLLEDNNNLLGFIAINPIRFTSFFNADFRDKTGNPRVISRLSVHPKYQGKGYASLMMDFAHNQIELDGFTSIRLGALKNYTKVVDFYIKRDYIIRGEITEPRTQKIFYLMEKVIEG